MKRKKQVDHFIEDKGRSMFVRGDADMSQKTRDALIELMHAAQDWGDKWVAAGEQRCKFCKHPIIDEIICPGCGAELEKGDGLGF